jgi:protein-ribulosamine 3-kinase
MLPDGVRREVESHFGAILDARAVGGGCISQPARIETEGRGTVFLKHHANVPARFFAAEAEGLAALRAAAGDGVRVPEVLAVCETTEPGPAWIALEWLEPAPRDGDFAERLGRGLAAVHREGRGWWGWGEANFIGSLPQENAPSATWADFWRDRRLTPQLDLARFRGTLPGSGDEWERLFGMLPEILGAVEEDGPSLLHGDLWSGNVLACAAGPALIDPAVYRGHREVDLAMAELFGGFDARFFAAYDEAWPILPGYREARRGVYQLYYLMAHVNLFGGSYVGQTASLLRRLIAA